MQGPARLAVNAAMLKLFLHRFQEGLIKVERAQTGLQFTLAPYWRFYGPDVEEFVFFLSDHDEPALTKRSYINIYTWLQETLPACTLTQHCVRTWSDSWEELSVVVAPADRRPSAVRPCDPWQVHK